MVEGHLGKGKSLRKGVQERSNLAQRVLVFKFCQKASEIVAMQAAAQATLTVTQRENLPRPSTFKVHGVTRCIAISLRVKGQCKLFKECMAAMGYPHTQKELAPTLVSPKLTPARAALINNVETMLDKLVGRISTE
eukprot:6203782-Pleurochrysis_carterae.AAC.3